MKNNKLVEEEYNPEKSYMLTLNETFLIRDCIRDSIIKLKEYIKEFSKDCYRSDKLCLKALNNCKEKMNELSSIAEKLGEFPEILKNYR